MTPHSSRMRGQPDSTGVWSERAMAVLSRGDHNGEVLRE
jgi:hypothetical protein